MRPSRRRVLRWLLSCALVLAVAGMHHVVPTMERPTAAPAHALIDGEPNLAVAVAVNTVAAPDESPAAPHDMPHHCLAAMALLVALSLLTCSAVRARRQPPPARDRAATPPSDRGPPPVPAGRSLLSSVCVWRL